MSTTTTRHEGTTDTTQGSSAESDTEHAEHGHPSDWAYVKIALILAIITAVEVFTYFETVLNWGRFLVPSLILMMVVKFWLVATWFMHLKFDNPIFSKMFVGGLVLAVGVYVATLTAFEFWA
ncbi:MAG: cytochrome C oxidase subunit IV family protein [Acidimicrobiaceae bacterium]|nr:cytochrome C oxidase subunit IV family protein [Acidimicrobiia bacterium]MCY4492298.1 cytochrome C oxidase subunit IV family protein [Acidimicrobiaceae bacterium]